MPKHLKAILTNHFVIAGLAVVLVALIAYAYGISRLGYYHDDWYMLWSASTRGANSLRALFSIDRPFMGFLYGATYQVLGDNVLGWHVYALLWRIAGAIAFYWILSLAFPKLKRVLVLAAMLFVVYPGFLALPNAATKINHLTGFGTALFSIAFTLQAIQTKHTGWRRILSVLAILSTAFYLWLYEYMLGLEVLRVVLIFWLYSQARRTKPVQAIKTTAKAYIPYFIVVAVFLYWRLIIFDSSRVATDFDSIVMQYEAGFGPMIGHVLLQTIKDFFSATVLAWGVQPYQLFTHSVDTALTAALLLALAAVILVVSYWLFTRKSNSPEQDGSDNTSRVLVLIGALATLAAVFPVVISMRYINLMDVYKGYGLHPSPGVIILVVGLVLMLKPRYRNIILVALIALSVATQVLNVQNWAARWEVQRDFWWQLTWRAPDIKDETLLMAYAPVGSRFQQDYEVWGPVNLIYNPDTASSPPVVSEVLDDSTAQFVINGQDRIFAVRYIEMIQNFRNLLLASQPTLSSCVHFIDGQLPIYSLDEVPIVQQVGPFAKLDRIETSAVVQTPPESIFGKEPEHGWCYFYQKASLARQAGDWQGIVNQYEAAVAQDLRPADGVEYFVVLEGLVNTGRSGEAEALLQQTGLHTNAALLDSLCSSLMSAPNYPADFGYQLEDMQDLLCSP